MTGIKIMYYTQVVNQVELLVDRTNPALYITQSPGAQLIKPLTQYPQFPGGWEERPIKQPDQRAFSCSAGANQGNPLSSPNLESYILQGRKITKRPADLEQFEYGLIFYGDVYLP